MHPTLTPRTRVGRYVVVAEVGTGGMGTVYRAVDSETGDLVALKLLAQECLVSDAEPRFLHEGWILESVHHPRVVRFRELGRAGPGCWFLAMDYVPGPSLRDRLAQGPLPIHEALEIADQLLDALGAVHATGVTHRDLKPANILLGDRSRPDVRLIDFGLAKVPDHALTRAGVFVGSPRYASTEQLRGAPVDGRTDLFAVGALLYAMLTGQVPFPGRTAREVIVQHRVQRPGRPSVARGDRLPVGLDALVLRLLLPEPSARPSRADDVRRELDRVRRAPLDSQRRIEARRDPESFEATVRAALPRGRLHRAWRRLQRFSA